MRYHEIIAPLVEEETITAWVNINALPEPEKKIAVAVFSKLAQDQRGEPEAMGAAGGDGNVGIHHARGIFEWLTEHVGDLTNRMAKAAHIQDCGFDYVGRKVDSALRAARHRYGMKREIQEQFLSTYEAALERGLTMSLATYKRQWLDASARYADAHAKLVVYNEAQWHARESAVTLGRHDFAAMTQHLVALEAHLHDETDWTNWAGLVRLDASKRPIPFRSGLHESVIAEATGGYFYVLSKGGHARVVSEDDPKLFKAWDDGWEVEWDSARSVEQGLKWAAEQKGLKPEPAPRETGSPFWFVFSKAGLARAIPEDDVDLGTMKKDGWKLEFDSARSKEQGLERARDQFGLKPWDSFLPRVMTEPKTLYRSVSLPELADIVKTGKIMGGGNLFNEFDPRRYVFFGDEISDELIFQGADTERQTQRLLADHPIHGKFKTLNDKLAAARQQVVQGAREYVWEINQRREDAGHPPLSIDEKLLDEFVKYGGSEHKVTEFLPRDPKDPIHKRWVAYQKLKSQMRPLQTQYQRIFRKAHADHDGTVNARPITSAIIETKPLSGGLEYSAKAGSRTGMDLPEFGFERGAVTLDDVIKVYWVKDRKITNAGSPATILPTLRRLGIR